MSTYRCNGDGSYYSDEIYFSIGNDALGIELEDDGIINFIEIADKEKVKEIARVLLAYLKEDT